jgi:hypothetical protein
VSIASEVLGSVVLEVAADRLPEVHTDMRVRASRHQRTTTEDVVEVSPAVLRRLATAEKLKVSALR